MKIFFQLISWVFLPLLMPIYALSIAMFLPSVEISFFQENTLFFLDDKNKYAIHFLFLIFSFVAPALSILLLMKSKTIQTIEMDDKKEREIPIFLTAIYALALALFLLIKAPNSMLPKVIYSLPWGGFFAIIISGFISRYDKISLHAMGVGMFLAFQFFYYHYQVEYYFEIIVISTLICGLVLSARLYLLKHNPKQIYQGFFLGFSIMLITLFLFPH
ncbi:MAG: hypothetical protein HYU67_11625 [Flavobacteriia bacterium]|nr:hypothetical protein [Flavobacteriia bacterium]